MKSTEHTSRNVKHLKYLKTQRQDSAALSSGNVGCKLFYGGIRKSIKTNHKNRKLDHKINFTNLKEIKTKDKDYTFSEDIKERIKYEKSEEKYVATYKTPFMEWWDMRMVRIKTESTKPYVQICEEIITPYLMHANAEKSPAWSNTSSFDPLRLTRKEIKNLSTLRRSHKEKERQELILLGILKPPEPKKKISNLIYSIDSVLSECYTQTELKIRMQIAEKNKDNEDRNLILKLTPLEARKKKCRKLFDENKTEIHTAVYRVAQPASDENRYKININAIENRMVGLCLITDNSTLLVVEGCRKSQIRYHRLLTKRINWKSKRGKEFLSENEICELLWHGIVKAPSFNHFKTYCGLSEAGVLGILQKHNERQVWNSVVKVCCQTT